MWIPIALVVMGADHVDWRDQGLIMLVLALAVVTIVSLLITYVSTILLAGYWGESLGILQRMYALLVVAYFGMFGLLAVVLELFGEPFLGSIFIGLTVGPAVIFGATHWSRRPDHPQWIGVIAWTVWGRVDRALRKREKENRSTAREHLEEELRIHRPAERPRRNAVMRVAVRRQWRSRVFSTVQRTLQRCSGA
jgi:hypothetical protein